MEENEAFPVLRSCKRLNSAHSNLQIIPITSNTFTLGRGLSNSIVIPFLAISRKHCEFLKQNDNQWIVKDHSSFGITINGVKLGKGSSKTLSHEDIISLEPSQEYVYKFYNECGEVFDIPRKRMKMTDKMDNTYLTDVKLKFEESQKYELKHIEQRIQNAKQMQTTSLILKEQIEADMTRTMKQLKDRYDSQINNIQGEKLEVERQKAMLIEERNQQLHTIEVKMETKVSELMEQIKKHNETECELLNENNLLKEKLQKEREEFLAELNRESNTKQDMLTKLEDKIKEQEEVRIQEKKEYEEMLQKRTEELKLAKEKELNDLEEQKRLREMELEKQLDSIKKDLQDQMEQTEAKRLLAEQELNEKMVLMKKVNDEDKAKVQQLAHEKAEIEKLFLEAKLSAEKSTEEMKAKIAERATELAALASDRIQKQAEQSTEVITTLQEQLERVQSELQACETEKNTLIESIGLSEPAGPAQQALAAVGELMESELQCSVCAELFVEATTLNCSHTFCKYCITVWKKKKNDCPVCRSPIRTECRSLVLDSFIEKMVQNLTEDMKVKRQEMLKFRAEQVTTMMNPTPKTNSTRRGRGRRRTTTTSTTTTSTSTTGRAVTATIPTPRPLQIVDLTLTPTPSPVPVPPPAPARAQVSQPVLLYQIQNVGNQMVVVVSDEGGASRAYRAPTTAATGAASTAALGDTGRPAAPTDS